MKKENTYTHEKISDHVTLTNCFAESFMKRERLAQPEAAVNCLCSAICMCMCSCDCAIFVTLALTKDAKGKASADNLANDNAKLLVKGNMDAG